MIRDQLWLIPLLAVVILGLTAIPIVLNWWIPVEPGHSAFSGGSSSDSGLLGIAFIGAVIVAHYIAFRKFIKYDRMPQTKR